MFAKERQDQIYALIQQKGAVTTTNLVNLFQVSLETIRRDLLSMEQNMLVKRVHGGAVAVSEMMPFHNLEHRVEENAYRKKEAAQTALQFIKEGDIICIDSGSTAITLAQAIKENFKSLTIVTHSKDVFDILCSCENMQVILCGGHFYTTERAFYGHLTIEMLNSLHMQKAFIFPTAVSIKNGICDYCQELCQVQKKIIASSDEIYVLADSSKFEKNALLKLDDMKQEYVYITDSKLSEEIQRLYAENNINIVTGDKTNE